MTSKLSKYGLSAVKLVVTAIMVVFSLISVLYVYISDKGLFDVFYCLATIPFACLPLFMSMLFKWKFNTVFYIIFSLYTLGPLLGAVYGLYYVTNWWDDLLHILAGVLFAVCGAYLAEVLNRGNNTSILLKAIFGFCVSLAIAVIWEVFEHSSDMLLGSDMQADTIVYSLSTKLGRIDGGVTVFDNISSVSVNGVEMGYGGYVDIGLIDTMRDMIVESAGALAYLIYAVIDRDKHPLLTYIGERKSKTR